MKTRQVFWSLGFIAAMAAAIVVGQISQTGAQVVEQQGVSQPLHRDSTDSAHDARQTCKASEMIGMNVRGLEGEDNIGSINDLVIDHGGRVAYVAVAFGGFLGMGDKLFAVPCEAIDFVKTDDDAYARIDVTEQTLKDKKGFNQDNWPTEADRTFSGDNLRRQAATQSVSR